MIGAGPAQLVPEAAPREALSLWRGVIRIEPSKLTMAAIAVEVAERHGVSVDELRGPQLRRQVTRARQEAMALIYATGRFSNSQIGRFMGGRDHTTVLHGRRSHAARVPASAPGAPVAAEAEA